MSDNRCRWCGKPMLEGDAAHDPRTSGSEGHRAVHSRCASQCRTRRQAFADVAGGPIGELVNLAAEFVAMVRLDGRYVVHAGSDGFEQFADAVSRAKGDQP
jgi:hypothetical protein